MVSRCNGRRKTIEWRRKKCGFMYARCIVFKYNFMGFKIIKLIFVLSCNISIRMVCKESKNINIGQSTKHIFEIKMCMFYYMYNILPLLIFL